MRQVDLGAGKFALAVENGRCWQGSCGRWLALYALSDKHFTRVFGDLITSDSVNATNSCSDLMKLNVGRQQRVATDDYSSTLGCYRIEGRSKIHPAANGPGQLVMEFSGKRTKEETVPIAVDGTASARGEDFDEDAPKHEFLVTIAAVQDRQIFNFQNGQYVLNKGRNPNPGL